MVPKYVRVGYILTSKSQEDGEGCFSTKSVYCCVRDLSCARLLQPPSNLSYTRHLYVVCTYLVLGTYSSSVRGRGLNQYWWPPKDHHSLLVLLRKTKFTFKSRKTLFAILLLMYQIECCQIVYYWIMHRKLIELVYHYSYSPC